MPRPKKTGFDYFPLDCHFFENKTIKNLRREHGATGVLTYINLLCRVYGGEGYYYAFDSLDELAMDVAEEIASEQIRRVASSVAETINYLVGRGTLDKGLFKRGIISGVALQEQYIISSLKAKRSIDMSVHQLVDVGLFMQKNGVSSEETGVSSEETGVSSEISTQSKVKKSKLNSCVNTNTTNITTAGSVGCVENQPVETVENYPPTVAEVSGYFKGRGIADHINQSIRFCKYNDDREWDCLPNWTNAADRWVDKIS